jgi:hypothetical protein
MSFPVTVHCRVAQRRLLEHRPFKGAEEVAIRFQKEWIEPDDFLFGRTRCSQVKEFEIFASRKYTFVYRRQTPPRVFQASFFDNSKLAKAKKLIEKEWSQPHESVEIEFPCHPNETLFGTIDPAPGEIEVIVLDPEFKFEDPAGKPFTKRFPRDWQFANLSSAFDSQSYAFFGKDGKEISPHTPLADWLNSTISLRIVYTFWCDYRSPIDPRSFPQETPISEVIRLVLGKRHYGCTLAYDGVEYPHNSDLAAIPFAKGGVIRLTNKYPIVPPDPPRQGASGSKCRREFRHFRSRSSLS